MERLRRWTLRLTADPNRWMNVTRPICATLARSPARRESAVDSALVNTASTRVSSSLRLPGAAISNHGCTVFEGGRG